MSFAEARTASVRLIAAVSTAVALTLGLAACGGDDDSPSAPVQPTATYDYVAFQSTDPVAPLTIPAKFSIPTSGQAKYPAVVIAHGSSGVDSRGPYYAELLNRAGIATLEIDMWSPRGFTGGSTGRPRTVAETLPDAFGGLKMLAADARIDARRIGVMGFSWGGVVSMLTATQPYANRYAPAGLRFAAHAPLYPICWGYNRVPGYEFASLTGAPVFIQAGELDAYDDPDSCPKLVAGLPAAAQAFVSVTLYPNATHGWDRLEPAITVTDPFAHKGQGGAVDFVPNPAVTEQSGAATVAFFRRAFGL
jgi:dienelactone hydrolase